VASERYPDLLWWHGLLQTDEHKMSFLAVRNAVGIGLGGIITLFGGRSSEQAQSNLLAEDGDNLVQEDGGLILLE
jgi:hypothetical protein